MGELELLAILGIIESTSVKGIFPFFGGEVSV